MIRGDHRTVEVNLSCYGFANAAFRCNFPCNGSKRPSEQWGRDFCFRDCYRYVDCFGFRIRRVMLVQLSPVMRLSPSFTPYVVFHTCLHIQTHNIYIYIFGKPVIYMYGKPVIYIHICRVYQFSDIHWERIHVYRYSTRPPTRYVRLKALSFKNISCAFSLRMMLEGLAEVERPLTLIYCFIISKLCKTMYMCCKLTNTFDMLHTTWFRLHSRKSKKLFVP